MHFNLGDLVIIELFIIILCLINLINYTGFIFDVLYL